MAGHININDTLAFSETYFSSNGTNNAVSNKIPSSPTRLKEGGIYNDIEFCYGRVLEFLIALPPELQLPILDRILVYPMPARKRRHDKSMKNIFMRWALCHRKLTPQVIEVWWKRNQILIRREWKTVIGDGNEFLRLKQQARYPVIKMPPLYARSMIRSIEVQLPEFNLGEDEIFINLLKYLRKENWPKLKRVEISVRDWIYGAQFIKKLIAEEAKIDVEELVLLPVWNVNRGDSVEDMTAEKFKLHVEQVIQDTFNGWVKGWEKRTMLRDVLTPDSEDKYERMLEITCVEQRPKEQQLAFEGGWLCSHLDKWSRR